MRSDGEPRRRWWPAGLLPGGSYRSAAKSIRISRGVERFIRRHGGSLFVWDQPFSDGFSWLKASTERPEGVEFRRDHEFRPLALWVEHEIWGREITLRLNLLRRGVTPDSGFRIRGGEG